MVKFFSQSHKYDDAWQTVTLAFFLRYPNPYASHVLSCDVISRTPTPSGTLLTTRLILKKGAVPKWFPQSFVHRAESWVIEESEVDLEGRVVNCRTRNLDHVKVMQVHEDVELKETADGSTMQTTTARIVSNFGWGLTKRIEKYGVTKLKSNLERSREGISLVLSLLRDSRARLGVSPLPLGMAMGISDLGGATLFDPSLMQSSQAADSHLQAGSDLSSHGDSDRGDEGARHPSTYSPSPSPHLNSKPTWMARWLSWRRPSASSSHSSDDSSTSS